MSEVIQVSGGNYKFQDVNINGTMTKCLVPAEPAFTKFKAGDKVVIYETVKGVIIRTNYKEDDFAVFDTPNNSVWDNDVNKTSEFLYKKGWRLSK